MSSSDKTPGNHARPSRVQPGANRRAGKAADRKGLQHAAGISREDFRRTSDLSRDVQADTLTKMNP